LAANTLDSESLPALLRRLFARINYERKDQVSIAGMKTDAITRLMERLGNPQLAYPLIHVAGTKGKGSVTRLAAAILSESGFITGTYTSPHLLSFNERISINGRAVSDANLAKALGKVFSVVDQYSEEPWAKRLTFFDLATATGFVTFALEKVDVAVIEVGLGGRLDSTNVCQPEVCVITNISFDHTRQLGNTLAQIAGEKAGIIKPGIPVVCGVEDDEPRQIIEAMARERNSQIFQSVHAFDVSSLQLSPAGTVFDLRLRMDPKQPKFFKSIELNLIGEHQVQNAALAIAACAVLCGRNPNFTFDEEAVYRATKSFFHVGRIEVVSRKPLVVLDVAHNVASTRALIAALQIQMPEWQTARSKTMILSVSRDKDQRGILAELLPHVDRMVFTRFHDNPRATASADLLEMALDVQGALSTNVHFEVCDNPVKAWEAVHRSLQPNDACCVGGSLFLVAELKQLIEQDLCEGIKACEA
jgi:dihydrofolate synthase / folylpolyglutamate synthase